MRLFNFGRVPRGASAQVIADNLNAVISLLESNAQVNDRPLPNPYALSNITPTRTLNASTATAADVANFVGTLVQDMASRGLVKLG